MRFYRDRAMDAPEVANLMPVLYWEDGKTPHLRRRSLLVRGPCAKVKPG